MENTKNYKCPKCGNALVLDSSSGKLKCENCKMQFILPNTNKESKEQTKSESTENNSANTNNNTETNTIKIHTCSDCNFRILTDINTSINSCINCKSTNIQSNTLQSKLPKTQVIPFEIDKNSAIKIYKNYTRNKPFKSQVFSYKKVANELIGMYIPLYLYDCDANGLVELNCKKNTFWKTGNYKYEKKDTYLVTRDASMSLVNIPIDTTNRFIDIINTIDPYDYSKLKPFEYSYLNSYALVPSSLTNEEILKESISKAKDQFIGEMKKSTRGYDEIDSIKNSINLYNSKMRSLLLPIWFVNIKCKNKIHTIAINGQTGKIAGDIPLNKNKVIIVWIVLFLILFLISFIICCLGVIL